MSDATYPGYYGGNQVSNQRVPLARKTRRVSSSCSRCRIRILHIRTKTCRFPRRFTPWSRTPTSGDSLTKSWSSDRDPDLPPRLLQTPLLELLCGWPMAGIDHLLRWRWSPSPIRAFPLSRSTPPTCSNQRKATAMPSAGVQRKLSRRN